MMRVTVDGVNLDIAVGGSGDAVVLLHGFPLSKEIWNVQAARLEDRALVICPDVRGAGASSAPSGPYLMETLAGDLAAILDAMQIERTSIVGHSMGGYIAMAFARMYTERVNKLALVCSKLRSDTKEIANNREILAQQSERDGNAQAVENAYITRLFAPQSLENNDGAVGFARELCNRYKPAGLAGLLRGMAQRPDSSDIAADLDLPVLIVAGRHDQIAPVAEAEETRATFPQADLYIMGASAHVPMLEEAEALADVLARFLP